MQAEPEWLTLAEAGERVRIMEVSEGGSVPDLRVANLGDLPLLLLDGEQPSSLPRGPRKRSARRGEEVGNGARRFQAVDAVNLRKNAGASKIGMPSISTRGLDLFRAGENRRMRFGIDSDVKKSAG